MRNSLNISVIGGGQRDTTLDTAKFVLIFLVCLGHLMQIDLKLTESVDALYRLIYSFHVPAFAFISGYLTNEKKFSIKKNLKLIETAVIGSILWFLIVGFPDNIRTILSPQYHLWYLPALVYWRLIVFHLVPRMGKLKLLLLSVILYFVIPATRIGYVFAIEISFTFLPFFLMGNIIRDKDTYTIKHIKKIASILIFVSVFVLYWLFPECGDIQHKVTIYGGMVYIIDRGLFLIIGSLLVFSFMRLITLMPSLTWMANQGKENMIYYIYHGFLRFGFLAITYNLVLPKGSDLTAISLGWFILGTSIILSIIKIISTFAVSNWLINPISRTISYIKYLIVNH